MTSRTTTTYVGLEGSRFSSRSRPQRGRVGNRRKVARAQSRWVNEPDGLLDLSALDRGLWGQCKWRVVSNDLNNASRCSHPARLRADRFSETVSPAPAA